MALSSLLTGLAAAQDWSQWRGSNRDGKVTGFNAPKTWPKTLTQKWRVTVGEGVATPALVGDTLYVFSRQEGNEVTRALNAATGKELWQEKYESLGASGAAQSFSGPRSSPTVAEGKLVTLGVRGMLSCLETGSGQKVWRKDEFQAYPRFHASSSPIIANGLCIAQLGGPDNGAVVAYNLADGAQKWKWNGPSPAYASPVVMTVNGTKLVLAQTETKLVALGLMDGALLWELAASSGGGGGPGGGPGGGGPGGRGGGMGGGRDYKAATPIVDGSVIITAGRGLKAVKLEKSDTGFVGKELWSSPDKSVQFNTPVLKNGSLYGLTGANELFCVNATDGKVLWSAPISATGADRPPQAGPPGAGPPPGGPPPGGGPPGGPPGGGPGGRGRGMGGGGGTGFGSIVDAGSVLLALTPSAELIAFQSGDKAYAELARIKVADSPTHAYPIASGNRIFIKDKDSVTLWTIE